MNENGNVPMLDAVEVEIGEVGERVDVTLPNGDVLQCTWLGKIGNGRELGQAMRLMRDIVEERETT